MQLSQTKCLGDLIVILRPPLALQKSIGEKVQPLTDETSLEAGLRVRGTYLCMRFSHRRRTLSIESRFSFSAPPFPPGAAPASDGWLGENRCLILIWHNAIFLGGKIYFSSRLGNQLHSSCTQKSYLYASLAIKNDVTFARKAESEAQALVLI